MTKFTDKERGKFYAQIANNPSVLTIQHYDQKRQKMQAFLQSSTQSEFTTTGAVPAGATSSGGVPIAEPVYSSFFAPQQRDEPNLPRVVHHHHSSDNFWFWMWLTSRNNTQPQNIYINSDQSTNNTSRSGSSNNSNDSQPSFKNYAMILLLLGVAALPAIGASVYLLGEVVNNFQRLYYNEGYLQAGLGFANLALSMALGIQIVDYLLANTITAMCVSAGFSNPVGWSFLLLTTLTLITAGILNLLQQNSLYAINACFYQKTALYPEEPHRFSLDADQASYLPKETDPEKVRIAITAIQHDMPKPGILRYNPFFLGKSASEKLQQIRSLRMHGQVNYETTIGSEEIGDQQTLHFTTASLSR